MEFVSNVYTVDGHKVIQCNIRDITERKIVEEALAGAAARDSAISILACRLVSSLSISDISGLVLQTAKRFTGSACGYIGYLDLDSGSMISPPAAHEIEHSTDGPEETGSFKRLEGLGAWVLNNPQSFLTNTATSDPRFAGNMSCSVPIHNLLSAPALIVGELVGQLVLANSSRDYIQIDLDFVQRLATLYAIAIQHHRKDEKISKMAYQDPLTGLPNRTLFNDRFGVALASARRYGKKIGLMVLDIDDFKHINDTLGHSAGDEVLKDFSLTLTSILRKTDTVMRSGGDEFVIMVTDVVELEHISDVAQKILEATRRPFTFQGREVRITVSIGISSYPEDGEEVEMLLKHADIAMYHIKATGRDNFARYLPGMET